LGIGVVEIYGKVLIHCLFHSELSIAKYYSITVLVNAAKISKRIETV
jgi:hypothetical protein